MNKVCTVPSLDIRNSLSNIFAGYSRRIFTIGLSGLRVTSMWLAVPSHSSWMVTTHWSRLELIARTMLCYARALLGLIARGTLLPERTHSSMRYNANAPHSLYSAQPTAKRHNQANVFSRQKLNSLFSSFCNDIFDICNFFCGINFFKWWMHDENHKQNDN